MLRMLRCSSSIWGAWRLAAHSAGHRRVDETEIVSRVRQPGLARSRSYLGFVSSIWAGEIEIAISVSSAQSGGRGTHWSGADPAPSCMRVCVRVGVWWLSPVRGSPGVDTPCLT